MDEHDGKEPETNAPGSEQGDETSAELTESNDVPGPVQAHTEGE